jgi:polysaccharide biosynthesis protein PelD
MNTTSLPTEQSRILGIRVSALIEMLVGFIVLIAIDMFLGAGNRFWDVNPHPFWIVVLIIAVQYGTAEAMIAAIIATVFYLLGNMPVRAEGVSFYDWLYSLSVNPVLWVIAAWVIGELRQRHIRERNTLVREVEESHQREDLIANSYNFVKGRKESLEVQVSGQLLSSIDAYRAAKSVETLDPKSVMQGVERLVKSVLGPQKFSMFIATDNKLNASIIHGWAAGDKYAQEIDSYSPLFQAVVGQRDLLVVANEQNEVSLDNQGILAGPILDPETSRVIGMLKIEQMDFTSLSLNTVETFRAVCDWIGTALVNARNYQSVKAEAIINPERNILSYSYFKRQSEYMRTLAKRVGFDLSMLVIKLNDSKSMNDADRITVARQIGESVKSVLRSVDLAFDYQTDGEEYSILLPATAPAGANIVRDKIAKDMDRALRGKSGVSFNYIVSALHEVR